MKVIVLGAGVVGTASAWYLAQAGHEVEVVERREGPGLETSFANGGQVSVCHALPWANPGAPLKILRWLARDDAPLLFRLRMDPAQWSWGLRFLCECLPSRARENTRQILAMSFYGRAMLQRLRADTGIAYEASTRGILHYYTEQEEFDAACAASDYMRSLGLDRVEKSVEEAVAIEPALASARKRIVGATFTPSDESGDAYVFTVKLATLAAAKGVRFRYGREIRALRPGDKGVTAAVVASADGGEETLAADAFVVALGSYSPLLTRPLGLNLAVYPAKGYSATVEVMDAAKAPAISLTDDEAKIVISRFGERIRIAGTAELSGYSTDLNAVRCEALIRRMREIFPGAAHYDRPQFWAGLRPSTPSNVPLVGSTRLKNLYLNTGHGTLGWTMACGSGAALADLLSGRKPAVDFRFTSP
jgi:D-amino-acid dehydrogenase